MSTSASHVPRATPRPAAISGTRTPPWYSVPFARGAYGGCAMHGSVPLSPRKSTVVRATSSAGSCANRRPISVSSASTAARKNGRGSPPGSLQIARGSCHGRLCVCSAAGGRWNGAWGAWNDTTHSQGPLWRRIHESASVTHALVA